MGYDMQLAKNMSKIEPRSLGLGLLIGCFVILFTYLSMSEPIVIPFTSVNSVSSPSSVVPRSSSKVEDEGSSPQLENAGAKDATQKNGQIGDDLAGVDQKSSLTKSQTQQGTEPKTEELSKKIDSRIIQQNSPSNHDSSKKEVRQSEPENKIENQHVKDPNDRTQESSPLPNLMEGANTNAPQMFGPWAFVGLPPGTKLICNQRDWRSDVCDLEGEVRIHGTASSVVSVNPQLLQSSHDKGPWRIRPYGQKGGILEKVKEITVRLSDGLNEEACTVKNSIPAIVLAAGGYTGNVYHAFNDVLIPLFITARQFDGEVQLFMTPRDLWFVGKYGPILKQLSKYEIIEFEKDDLVRCYPHVFVGCHSHKDMGIDPARTPGGYSMTDFTKLVRAAYSLKRDTAVSLSRSPGAKPRLLIISRGLTRKFLNIDAIAERARTVGFEVVVSEARFETQTSEFAQTINSCDVMMGAHGAGLTNEIFLPPNGILIQVVPWGNLEGISQGDYGQPAIGMGLRYLQYSIKAEESTLIDKYPRDHVVFTDPESLHKQGWAAMGKVFLVEQDIRLDIERFTPILHQAMELLKQ